MFNYPFLTSKERDNETGLDYFGARYYGTTQGRFTSVDPIGVKLARMIDPPQLNRYSFVRNNPLKYVDADGNDLKLAPGLKKADVETIIKHVVSLYRKQSGRDALERMERSKVEIAVGTGKLPTKIDLMQQTVTDQFGNTAVNRTNTTSTKSGQIVASQINSVTVTFDFGKRNDSQNSAENNKSPEPPSEQHVVDHEFGHVDRVTVDPLGSATDKDPEKPAEAFSNGDPSSRPTTLSHIRKESHIPIASCKLQSPQSAPTEASTRNIFSAPPVNWSFAL